MSLTIEVKSPLSEGIAIYNNAVLKFWSPFVNWLGSSNVFWWSVLGECQWTTKGSACLFRLGFNALKCKKTLVFAMFRDVILKKHAAPRSQFPNWWESFAMWKCPSTTPMPMGPRQVVGNTWSIMVPANDPHIYVSSGICPQLPGKFNISNSGIRDFGVWKQWCPMCLQGQFPEWSRWLLFPGNGQEDHGFSHQI